MSLPPILKQKKLDLNENLRLIENPRSKELQNKFSANKLNLNNQNNRYKDENIVVKPYQKKLD